MLSKIYNYIHPCDELHIANIYFCFHLFHEYSTVKILFKKILRT